jgi:uncharacterized membrane protein
VNRIFKTLLSIFLIYSFSSIPAFAQGGTTIFDDVARDNVRTDIFIDTFTATNTVKTYRSANSEVITSYVVDLNVAQDATMNVTETITYNFGTNQKHGIYRDIPYIIINQDGKRFKLNIQIVSVTNELKVPYKYSTSTIGDNFQIKIGDAGKFVTGQKIYKITYTVKGGIRYFSDHDELYWNTTGTKWNVPIDVSKATVTIPKTGTIDNVTCYTGGYGSTEQNCLSRKSQNNASFSAINLNTNEGLTIVASFPKSIIAVVEPKEDKPGIISSIISLLFLLGAFFWYFIAPFAIIINWFRAGRDPETSPNIPVWYDPPQNKQGEKTKPAEVGALTDESADNRDISATIVDLAIKGYLKIKEEGKDKFSLIKTKEFTNDGSLLDFEKDTLNGLFDGKTETTTKKLANTFYETANKVKNNLYDRVVKDGFFDKNPQSTRIKYYTIAGIALFSGNLFLALVAFLFGKNMPRKTLLGAQANVVALGMKKFLTSQERQLEFQAKNWMFFEKLLPFAIVFSVEKIWAERFKDIAVEPPTWYEGSNWQTFNTIYFIDSLNRSTSAMNSMSTTPTRSSSGFSSGFGGGGFSGGGGGGGGGGSW